MTNNEWDGQVKTYHTNGLLERQFEYEKGTLNGQYTAYDSEKNCEHIGKGEFIAYRYFDKEDFKEMTENLNLRATTQTAVQIQKSMIVQ